MHQYLRHKRRICNYFFDDIMSHIDKKDSGRCFSFTPSLEMIGFGIRAVILRIWDYSKLYFDTRGLVKTAEETSKILIGKLNKNIGVRENEGKENKKLIP